jgi:hypothetical protein
MEGAIAPSVATIATSWHKAMPHLGAAAALALGWTLLQVALALLPEILFTRVLRAGRWLDYHGGDIAGPVLAHGKRYTYRINGLQAWAVTHLLALWRIRRRACAVAPVLPLPPTLLAHRRPRWRSRRGALVDAPRAFHPAVVAPLWTATMAVAILSGFLLSIAVYFASRRRALRAGPG